MLIPTSFASSDRRSPKPGRCRTRRGARIPRAAETQFPCQRLGAVRGSFARPKSTEPLAAGQDLHGRCRRFHAEPSDPPCLSLTRRASNPEDPAREARTRARSRRRRLRSARHEIGAGSDSGPGPAFRFDSNPTRLWLPSQNGWFAVAPQRQGPQAERRVDAEVRVERDRDPGRLVGLKSLRRSLRAFDGFAKGGRFSPTERSVRRRSARDAGFDGGEPGAFRGRGEELVGDGRDAGQRADRGRRRASGVAPYEALEETFKLSVEPPVATAPPRRYGVARPLKGRRPRPQRSREYTLLSRSSPFTE